MLSAVALVLADLLGLSSDVYTAIGAVAGVAAVFVTVGLGIAQLRRMAPDQASRSRPADQDDIGMREWSLWLRGRVMFARVDVQLNQMLRAAAENFDAPVFESVRVTHRIKTRPRLLLGGQLVPWSEITRQWDISAGPMVVLGDAGYGKTVAALTLVEHINSTSADGSWLAELFPLADWFRWRSEIGNGTIRDWLVAQLTLTYQPELQYEVARALVTNDLVIPVFDGLDEVSSLAIRRECVNAIDEYARRSRQQRPFIVTCRAREYLELAPGWVDAKTHVGLAGLQPDQIEDILGRRTVGLVGWDNVRDRYEAGDEVLTRLFASPLRLATALQIYHERDPRELLVLNIEQAQARLWDLSLSRGANGFHGASPRQVRQWLQALAKAIERSGRERFLLHELFLVDPDEPGAWRSFRTVVALLLGIASAIAGSALAGVIAGGLCGIVQALVTRRFLQRYPSIQGASPCVAASATRLRRAGRAGLIAGAIITAVVGVRAGTVAAILVAGALLLVLTGLTLVLTLQAGTEAIRAAPPEQFAGRRLDAVLIASRSHGLRVGITCGLFYGLTTAAVGSLTAGAAGAVLYGAAVAGSGLMLGEVVISLLAGVAGALLIVQVDAIMLGSLVGLAVGLQFALRSGLGAWIYHYWLRLRLSRTGLLPMRLVEFLEWGEDSKREWLRNSDGCEFRHRELREYLVAEASDAR